MNPGRIRKWPLGLVALLGIACHSAPGEASHSFFDKLDGLHGVSQSLADSRRMGLLLRPLRCTPNHLVLGDSVDLDIREAFLEKGWQCGPGCASVRALNQDERNVQIVLRCTPSSTAGSLNLYWFWDLGDRQTGFSEAGSGGLVSDRFCPDVAFPLTYQLYTRDQNDQRHLIGSFVLR